MFSRLGTVAKSMCGWKRPNQTLLCQHLYQQKESKRKDAVVLAKKKATTKTVQTLAENQETRTESNLRPGNHAGQNSALSLILEQIEVLKNAVGELADNMKTMQREVGNMTSKQRNMAKKFGGMSDQLSSIQKTATHSNQMFLKYDTELVNETTSFHQSLPCSTEKELVELMRSPTKRQLLTKLCITNFPAEKKCSAHKILDYVCSREFVFNHYWPLDMACWGDSKEERK